MEKITALPQRPEEMNDFFARAFNSGIVDNLNRLFEPGAKIINKDGNLITGKNEINQEHIGLLKIGGKMTSINKYCVVFEDIALLRADWKIVTKDENGKNLEINGSSTEIVRKQKNGDWLYIVDNPFGAIT
ncbi:DUF4440 domain-containing protein [Muricauda ruestringensis]|uniref:DUF4440 domain-containing protein n=1 Tax=Flagellimonas aurea TaxID=2915619 RepID=A0ABS3G9Q3_9FLAO|nr:DUF4440 domain-containing protein [Allomuricauda aurea]MBO0356008.1 DUF4440 domain-containing protein [Allomuricauda aurea]